MKYPFYCFSATFGSFEAEAKYAKDLGIYIFYDEDKDVFLDKDDNVIDLTGLEIMPRTGVLQAQRLVDAIYKNGGKCVVKKDDYEKTLNWPKYVKTKRNNIIMTGREIINCSDKIVEMFGVDRVFFKTKKKNYSQVLDIEKLISKEGSFYQALEKHKDDDFIISDVVDIAEDEFGPLEYRGYILDGELFNVSRINDYLMEKIPTKVIDMMQDVIKSVKDTDFPESFVLDVFVCNGEDGEYLDILECNPIVASGTYLYNSVFARTGSLEHDDPVKAIPKEKIKYGPADEYGFDVKTVGYPSICYKLPGGFAADLITFAMFGQASDGTFIHLEAYHNIDLTNIGPVKLKNIDSDQELMNDSQIFGSSDDGMVEDELMMQLRKRISQKSISDDEG